MTARITVYVQPRASKSEIAGMHAGCVKIRLAAPPVEGAANEALIEFVAERLGIARRNVRIVAGQASRRKTIEVDALSQEALQLALLGETDPPSGRLD